MDIGFHFSGVYTRSRIAGPCGLWVLNTLRNHLTALHSSCSHSPRVLLESGRTWGRARIPFFSAPPRAEGEEPSPARAAHSPGLGGGPPGAGLASRLPRCALLGESLARPGLQTLPTCGRRPPGEGPEPRSPTESGLGFSCGRVPGSRLASRCWSASTTGRGALRSEPCSCPPPATASPEATLWTAGGSADPRAV